MAEAEGIPGLRVVDHLVLAWEVHWPECDPDVPPFFLEEDRWSDRDPDEYGWHSGGSNPLTDIQRYMQELYKLCRPSGPKEGLIEAFDMNIPLATQNEFQVRLDPVRLDQDLFRAQFSELPPAFGKFNKKKKRGKKR